MTILDELRSDLASAQALVIELSKDLKAKNLLVEKMRQQLDALLRNRYGQKAEKINLDELLPAFRAFFEQAGKADPSVATDETAAEIEPPAKRKKGHGRNKLSKDLPVQEVIHDVPIEDRVCPQCDVELTSIGSDVDEQLEYIPASVVRIRNLRMKYACKQCEEYVVSAPKPAKAIAKGLPGPGMLAHVVTSKYADHLPLYRIEQIFKRQGAHIRRSTLCDWMFDTAALLEPIVEATRTEILKSQVVFTDDTTIPFQANDSTKTKKGRLWVHVGDTNHRYVHFDFTIDRSHEGPARMFKDYRGYLQADAYSAYDRLYLQGIREVACWAHARRKFYEQKDNFPEIAFPMLAMIRQLYDVEREAKEFEEEELAEMRRTDPNAVLDMARPRRHAMRRERSRPILDGIEKYLKSARAQVLPSQKIAEAIEYALRHWSAFNSYLEQGYLEIDNNLAERMIKLVVIGRKNWLFAGSETGGKTAASLFSLTATCNLLKIDTFAYLRDVISSMSGGYRGEVSDLLPDRWAARRALAASST